MVEGHVPTMVVVFDERFLRLEERHRMRHRTLTGGRMKGKEGEDERKERDGKGREESSYAQQTTQRTMPTMMPMGPTQES